MAIAFAAFFSVIPMIILMIIFRNTILYTGLLFVMIVLVSIYIVIDVQLILKTMGPDDYIIAVVFLYSDIITLFLYILKFLA
jgi:FtsH-binding integral membrane protein